MLVVEAIGLSPVSPAPSYKDTLVPKKRCGSETCSALHPFANVYERRRFLAPPPVR